MRRASGPVTSTPNCPRPLRTTSRAPSMKSGQRIRGIWRGSANEWTSAFFRSSSPSPRLATVVTTGTPRRSARSSWSIFRPFRFAASHWFRAMTIGIPSSAASETRSMLRLMFVASTTQTIRSGAMWPARPPSASITTRSSGDAAARLYVPGRSTSSIFTPPSSRAPTFFSTVMPG